MRIALLSDVHGNLPAFRSVLAAIDDENVDETWCLGDLVGYGAEPDGCVELARETLRGLPRRQPRPGRDKEIPISDFSSSAAAAALWTREHISAESLEFLRGRPASDPEREPGLYHGSPRDPVWEYVLSTWQADECMDLMSSRVAAIGHSHVALWFGRAPSGEVDGGQAHDGDEADLSAGEWLINPGQRRPTARW